MNNDNTATITLSLDDWHIIQYAMNVAIRNGLDGNLPKQVNIRLSLELTKHRIWMSLNKNDKVNV